MKKSVFRYQEPSIQYPVSFVNNPINSERFDLKSFLEEKYNQYNQPFFIETDPIQIPKLFSEKEDIEIAAFLTATIAWGNRQSIIKSAHKLMRLMEMRPYDFTLNASVEDLQSLGNFVHRTFNGDDAIYFIRSLQNIYRNHSGLKHVFEGGFSIGNSVFSSLENFFTVFFELPGQRTKHVSNVAKGAAAKRLNMFLRWMVREDNSKVDFGLWKGIPTSSLMLPLDVHTANVARKLGLLYRKSNDWKAVEEVTAALHFFDKNDPVKYDFALFGLGAFEKF